MDNRLYQSASFIILCRIAFLLAFSLLLFGVYGQFPQTSSNCHSGFFCFKRHTSIAEYASLTLSLIIIWLGIWALIRKRLSAAQPLLAPWLLVIATLLQFALNKTSLFLSFPAFILITQLILATLTVGVLWWILLATHRQTHPAYYHTQRLRPFVLFALFLFLLHIAFDLWVSANADPLIVISHHGRFIQHIINLSLITYVSLLTLIMMTKSGYHTLRLNSIFIVMLFVGYLAFEKFVPWHLSTPWHIWCEHLFQYLLFIAMISLCYKLYGWRWERYR